VNFGISPFQNIRPI